MKLLETLARLNRVQQSRSFKIAASVVVVLVGLAVFITYVVRVNAPDQTITQSQSPDQDQARPDTPAGDPDDPSGAGSGKSASAEAGEVAPEAAKSLDQYKRILAEVQSGRSDPTGVAIGAGLGVLVSLVIIWLGLALTYLALILAGVATALVVRVIPGMSGVAPVILGVLALSAAFTALMRVVRLALAPAHPVFAIARNVLDEGVRLKLSLVFIVLLILFLAALPTLLQSDQPLRYRIQSFLQYATGGAFWLIAMLTVVFSAASVAFEQRDRIIWQTMTKPVPAWQYVLGKWLGVASLGAVLLCVCGAGIFLFTEYLRLQPAVGERKDQAFVAAVGSGATADRFAIEKQILAARKTVKPVDPLLDEEQFKKNIEERVNAELQIAASDFERMTPAQAEAERERIWEKLTTDLRKSVREQHMAIEPGQAEVFRFEGLLEARRRDEPLMLRYKIDAGNNAPEDLYRVTFAFRGGPPEVRRAHLGQASHLTLLPWVIDDEGVLEIQIFNGDAPAMAAEGINETNVNRQTMSFPPDGLEISYSAGSYRANFFRVMFVLWVKLAFLAMLGVASATFLSFPVACLVSVGTFMVGEGAKYLKQSLETFRDTDDQGNVLLVSRVITRVAEAVEWAFRTYGGLNPTGRLVDGILLSWLDVAWGTTLLVIWTLILFGFGSFVLARRELATYSGH